MARGARAGVGRRTCGAAMKDSTLHCPTRGVPGGSWPPGAGNEIDASGVPGCALEQAAQRQPRPAGGAVPLDRLGGVGAARRVEAAARRQCRADRPGVEPDDGEEYPPPAAPDHAGPDPPLGAGPAPRTDRGGGPRTRRRPLGLASDDEVGSSRQPVQLVADHRPQTPRHPVADHRVADRPPDHQTGPRTGRPHRDAGRPGAARVLGPFGEEVEHHGRPPGAAAGPDDRGELRTPAQARLRGQHVRRRASRDPCAAAGEDRPARAGPHPQPEAVGLGPTAVVRLERALAHEVLPLHDIDGAHPPVGGRARGADGRRSRVPRPGSWSLRSRTPAPPGSCVLRERRRRSEPSTDSGQHNRGTRRRPAAGRIADRPWSPRRRSGGCGRAVVAGPADADAPGRVARALPGCGRGC